jgi:hypothetical protein
MLLVEMTQTEHMQDYSISQGVGLFTAMEYFETVLKIFYQVYLVHGIVNYCIFLLMYSLCVRKDEAAYVFW